MGSGYSSKDEIRQMMGEERDLSKINRIPPKEADADEQSGPPKKVGVYCRVSTDGISQTLSFELQKKYYIKYVRNHPGWILKCLYSDEGISATSVKRRDGLLRLIEDAKAGVIDLVVVKNISRLSRNLKDSLRIIGELKALPSPVGIFFESEGLNTLDPAMDLIIRVLSILAEEESKKKSEAITASVRQRYEEGFYLVQPVLGYKKTGVNKIDIDEAEAETVRLIYDMYLAGFGAKKIAEVLMELGLRKHDHHYCDGRIKRGSENWSPSSVLNVFNNEKRCGDVNAQKTYTFDCIDHIVRKNERNVPQYYARDQHPAIISRETFYLGLKLKDANRGGWDKGIPALRTCMSGALRGYVRAVPGWFGFSEADYYIASLKAYGIDAGEMSLYPDYVFSEKYSQTSDASEENRFLYYEVSESEFNSDPVITPEEYELLKEDEPGYVEGLLRLRKMQESLVSCAGGQKFKPASVWMFSMQDKPVATFDKNGISFNKRCFFRLAGNGNEDLENIELLYNPITEKVLVRAAGDMDEKYSLHWCDRKDGTIEMRRCSARAFCCALYKAMGWNADNRYMIPGSRCVIDDTDYLEFDLGCSIVRAYLGHSDKDGDAGEKKAEESKLELIKEEAKNSGAYYVDDDIETYVSYITGKVESKSRAVYFETDLPNGEEPVNISDYGDKKYDPAFIKTLLEKDTTPSEGWDYLKEAVTWTNYGFQIPSEGFLREAGYIEALPDLGGMECQQDSEATASLTYENLGWTQNYTFPRKEDVLAKIEKLKKLRNSAT